MAGKFCPAHGKNVEIVEQNFYLTPGKWRESFAAKCGKKVYQYWNEQINTIVNQIIIMHC